MKTRTARVESFKIAIVKTGRRTVWHFVRGDHVDCGFEFKHLLAFRTVPAADVITAIADGETCVCGKCVERAVERGEIVEREVKPAAAR